MFLILRFGSNFLKETAVVLLSSWKKEEQNASAFASPSPVYLSAAFVQRRRVMYYSQCSNCRRMCIIK
jgi:hypothetical protein